MMEYHEYEDSLKAYRDLKNSLDTARREERVEIAKNMLAEGFDEAQISRLTKMSIEEIREIKLESGL